MRILTYILFLAFFLGTFGCRKAGCPANEAMIKEQKNFEKGKASKPMPLFGPDVKYKKKKK
jgi:hypothetical protein